MSLLNRTIWLLSLVSLFTDMASELLFPVLPIYLSSIHFSVLYIGVLEGVAEALAGISKGYFGRLSDRNKQRIPFVRWGYGLSALSKPLMVVYSLPLWVLFMRTLDRLGKGVRSAARDALLHEAAKPGTKAAVFGFHRSADTLGAVVGPLLAIYWLHGHPGQYKELFYVAFVPGLLAIACTFLLKSNMPTPTDNPVLNEAPKGLPRSAKVKKNAFWSYWHSSNPLYKQWVLGLVLFALCNSSDAFLILRWRDAGLSDTHTIGMYVWYNVVYAIGAYPIGILADKVGVKRVYRAGILLFAVVYMCMATTWTIPQYVFIMAVYGLYAAATDGVAKALLVQTVPATEVATAMGTYTSFQSLATLLSSILTGLLWYTLGATATFLILASTALCTWWYLQKLQSI